jgi:phosphoribosylanthranilate isomerase
MDIGPAKVQMTTMSLVVKICGLRSPETIDAAIEAGADMLGFVFFSRSPRNVPHADAMRLNRHIGGRAKKVALVVDASDRELETIMEALAPDMIQCHGEEEPRRIAEIRSRYQVPVMKAIGVRTAADVRRHEDYRFVADRVLFDAKPPAGAALPGGNGKAFDWSLLAGLDVGKPMMLSGGLDPTNVAEALAVTGAPGVDVSSGVETKPGEKDPRRIAAFVAAARAAAKARSGPGASS